MSSFEVPQPIQNPPFEKPARYRYIREGEQPELRAGRRPPIVFPPRDQKTPWDLADSTLTPSAEYSSAFELALVNDVLGREVGGKQNILVMNDEAHHAYRIKREEKDSDDDAFGEKDVAEDYYKEATVWVEGLDRIHKLRGINFCVDLSATPDFLGRVGRETNKPFPSAQVESAGTPHS